MSQSPLISVVIPAMNEAACLPRLHHELRAVCDPLPYRFEFVFVDDGSTDGSPVVLAGLRRDDPRVRFLVLSRNFGHQAALSAGLLHAAGDAVVMMDGDLQHPPGVIPRLLQCWREGFEVVNTLRVETADIGPLKKLWSSAFYRVFNGVSQVKIAPGGADFRLMGRAAVEALNAMPERHRFLRGLVPWLGFRQTSVEFKAPPRFAGRSKYGFLRNIRFALEGLTAFSFYPLRVMTLFGWAVTFASLCYGLFAVAMHLLGGWTAPGWTSLLVCVLFLGGSQLATLGIMSEYIGRTLEQVKGRPMFILREAVGFGSGAGRDGHGHGVPAHHLTRPGRIGGERGSEGLILADPGRQEGRS